MPRGIFVLSDKKLTNNSNIKSDNTSIVFHSKTNYREKNAKIQSGVFKHNVVSITANLMAQLNGLIQSFGDIKLASEKAILEGTQKFQS